MEQRTPSPYRRRDRLVLALVGVLLVVSLGLFAWKDWAHDWRYYQWEFKNRIAGKLGEEKASTVPSGMLQVWVPALRRADRCVMCHQATSWKGFEDAREPLPHAPAGDPREPPGRAVRLHLLPRRAGLRGGRGGGARAGPVLGGAGARGDPRRGLLARDGEGCAHADELQRLPPLRPADEGRGGGEPREEARGEKGCRACHVINGRGGNIGPDLTYVGDKAAEQFDYTRLLGQQTMFAWHVAHFKEPRAIVPDTVMPNFNFSTEQVQALAMLVMSWRKVDAAGRVPATAPRARIRRRRRRSSRSAACSPGPARGS